MGNVMVLKPFETSSSIVYKGKGEVKAVQKEKAKMTQTQISKFQNKAWLVEPRLTIALQKREQWYAQFQH